MKSYKFSFISELRASPEDVWQIVGRMDGVNRELFPLARMTIPKGFKETYFTDFPREKRAFRSWILLFGLIPMDYDDITIKQVYPNGGFLEIFPMGSMKTWQHDRKLEATEIGCRLKDEVKFIPKLAILGSIYYLVFKTAFRLRHRNLRRMFKFME